jgi:hypothetical protein
VATTELDRLPYVLADALTAARPRRPRALAWRLARALWWLAVMGLAAGVGWLGWYVAARADGSAPDLPDVVGVAWPAVLVAAGLVVITLFLLVGRPVAAARARRYRSRVDRRLREATTAVARDVLAPVRGVLRDYAEAHAAYQDAAAA